MSEPVAAVLAHVAHVLDASVLLTPASTNELGCADNGLAGTTPEEALKLAEDGTVKAIVLLGSDPVGSWPRGERWRAARPAGRPPSSPPRQWSRRRGR